MLFFAFWGQVVKTHENSIHFITLWHTMAYEVGANKQALWNPYISTFLDRVKTHEMPISCVFIGGQAETTTSIPAPNRKPSWKCKFGKKTERHLSALSPASLLSLSKTILNDNQSGPAQGWLIPLSWPFISMRIRCLLHADTGTAQKSFLWMRQPKYWVRIARCAVYHAHLLFVSARFFNNASKEVPHAKRKNPRCGLTPHRAFLGGFRPVAAVLYRGARHASRPSGARARGGRPCWT